MDHRQNPFSSAGPRLPPPSKHRRNVSRSPTRAHRGSVTEDIFRDFAPARILEAFNNPTGRLKSSMDAAGPVDRAIGLRAAVASTNILSWNDELESWEWPDEGGCVGFDLPPGKRRRLSQDRAESQHSEEQEYLGSLRADVVVGYEKRVHQIQAELAEMNMEEIKRHVLETHFMPSRPSSSASNISSTYSSSFTRMEDFTAVVTATVLKALPNLGKLMRLMEVWVIRIGLLHRVPRLLKCFSAAELAMESGWATIHASGKTSDDDTNHYTLSRESFETVRNIIQEKVGRLGRDLDYMLDTLEGREDTLPDAWLDRMEVIEQDYSNWTVAGDRKVREGEWARQAKIRKQLEEEEALKQAEISAREESEREVERVRKEQAQKEAVILQQQRQAQEALLAQKSSGDATSAQASASLPVGDLPDERGQMPDQQIMMSDDQPQENITIGNGLQKPAYSKAKSNKGSETHDTNQETTFPQKLPDELPTQLETEKLAQDASVLDVVKLDGSSSLVKQTPHIQESAFQADLPLQAARSDEIKTLRPEQIQEIRVGASELGNAEAPRSEETSTAGDGSAIPSIEDLSKPEEALTLGQRSEVMDELLPEHAMTDKKADIRTDAVKYTNMPESIVLLDNHRSQPISPSMEVAEQALESNASSPSESPGHSNSVTNKAWEVNSSPATSSIVGENTSELTSLFRSQEVINTSWFNSFTSEASDTNLGSNLIPGPIRSEAHASEIDPKLTSSERPNIAASEDPPLINPIEMSTSSSSIVVSPLASSEQEPTSPQKAALEAARRERAEVERLRAVLEAKRISVANPDVAHYLRGWTPDAEVNTSSATSEPAKDKEVSPTDISKYESLSHREALLDDLGSAKPTNSSRYNPKLATHDGAHDDEPPSQRGLVHQEIIRDRSEQKLSSPYPDDTLSPPFTAALDVSGSNRQQSQDLIKVTVIQKPDSSRTSTSHLSPEVLTPTPASPISESHSSSRSTPRILHTPTFGPVLNEDAENDHAFPTAVTPARPQTETVRGETGAVRMQFSAETGTFSLVQAPSGVANFVPHKDALPEDKLNIKPLPDMPREYFQQYGYSTAEPTPEILDAEPLHYFRSKVPAVTSSPAPGLSSGTGRTNMRQSVDTTYDADSLATTFDVQASTSEMESPRTPQMSMSGTSFGQGQLPISGVDGAGQSFPAKNIEFDNIKMQPIYARKTSVTSIGSASEIHIPRRDSASSSTSTIVNNTPKSPTSPRRRSSPPPPLRPTTPPSSSVVDGDFQDDLSPSIRRHRNGRSHDYTSPDSPPPIPQVGNRSPISPRLFGSFSSTSEQSHSPTTPARGYEFPSISTTSPKKASTDEQLQQQISTLLESIPARIRLTNTANTGAQPSAPLNVKKTRRSVGPALRSSSSFSNYSRAPTPSFTLAPAHSSTQPRQRSNNGNSEIKVYHLSRSTGEAPIKLFVRLVGEHGERVMVRVGGGWADLGEYLKEYASHHGRRAPVGDDDNVEIQDLPSRNVSASFVVTPQNGRSSPVPRSASALHRPSSSLNVRKGRKSVGDSLDLPSSYPSFRSPSTPMPSSSLSRMASETPGTSAPNSLEKERSSSRMSWIEDDSSTLGLAGPNGKRITISEKDQEWVDSMKEKVRLASAEKDREKERERRVASGGVNVVGRRRETSFGEMESVGGTRRLFKKS